MKTILDSGESWFFHKIVHDEALNITVVEGMRAAEPEELIVCGKELSPAYRVDITEHSRWVRISWDTVIAHQVVDESITFGDPSEVHDQGHLRIYEYSRYLRFLQQYATMDLLPNIKTARHYCVVTEDRIIDVISLHSPECVLIPPETSSALLP